MTPDAASKTRFEAEIARYNKWREDLTQSVNAYHDWLEGSGQLDVQQSIRFYDLLENLNKGRLMLAFLAEFSRGKSELINALFFSSFKERLLPSDVGRTTMCPTEIFHDPSEEPYLKLLSVETRYRDESISQLKNMPVEWSKIRLNTGSAKEMKEALKALADTKRVYALEARMLGLAPMLNEKGELPGEEELVEVPAWRYAMINYPHPLLSNGLSILDTPGLNALGMEPELTVSTVPNAHAILFLLSIDTGVTKSDMEIWSRYVRPGLPQKIAVLNKIDLMWDELKTPQEVDRAIARMVETTSQALQLPRERIFAISAQKALLGKVREDAGLVRKSGIEGLERFLADEIVPMKRQILCRAVVGEIGGMMASSRASIAKKQQANHAEIAELAGLVGKSREVVTKLWQKITAEKNAYNAALAEFKVNHAQFGAKKAALMDMLNPARMDAMLGKTAESLEGSWTTVGLQRGMRELARQMAGNFEAVFAASEDIKKLMQGVYNTFVEKFGFQKMTIPSLDLELHNTKLKLLVAETDAFSRDPLNVAAYKSFFVKKFYNSLVSQARSLFTDARTQSERWVQAVTMPIEVQIKDHKAQLQSRLDSLAKINEKSSSINEQMALLKAAESELKKQRDMIEGLIARVSQHEAKAALAPEPVAAPATLAESEVPAELMKTTKLATFEASARAAAKAAAAAAAAAPRPSAAPAAPAAPSGPLLSDDFMAAEFGRQESAAGTERTQRVPAAPAEEAQRTQRVPAPADDAQRTQRVPAPADDAQRTQRVPAEALKTQRMPAQGVESTQRLAAEGVERTQRLAAEGVERTQRLAAEAPGSAQNLDFTAPEPPRAPRPGESEKTQKAPAVDPGWKPDATQKLEPAAGRASSAETTQKLDESIWKLQEARRILQGLGPAKK